jgi:hypothetical protein
VVTHQTTNRPACGLSTAERTGSPVFHTLWSYVAYDSKELLKPRRAIHTTLTCNCAWEIDKQEGKGTY